MKIRPGALTKINNL